MLHGAYPLSVPPWVSHGFTYMFKTLYLTAESPGRTPRKTVLCNCQNAGNPYATPVTSVKASLEKYTFV